MSNIEDDIRRVMAGHDDEAPDAADLLRALEHGSRPRRHRAGWYLPLAAAAAVAAVAVGSVWAGGLLGGHRHASGTDGGSGRVPRLSCPASYVGVAPWVPAKPVGVDGRSRLVPQRTPRSGLVCAYAGSNLAKRQAGWKLSGRRSLTGGLARLAAQLAWQPRTLPGQQLACTDVGGRQTNYLIGMTYSGGGRIWVAATQDPNACVDSSNGEFTSFGVVGPDAGRALASGRWPVRRPVSCTGPGAPAGRLGQDAALVPAGSTSLTICAPKARTFTSGYQTLVSALNALPARRSTRSCAPAPGPSKPPYVLFFAYPQGPPVWIYIDSSCHPSIDNLSLQSDSARSILPIIRQLLKPA